MNKQIVFTLFFQKCIHFNSGFSLNLCALHMSIFLWNYNSTTKMIIIYWNFFFLKEYATIWIAVTKHFFPASLGACDCKAPQKIKSVGYTHITICCLSCLVFSKFHVWPFSISAAAVTSFVLSTIYVMGVSKGLNKSWSFITWLSYIPRKENSFSWRVYCLNGCNEIFAVCSFQS